MATLYAKAAGGNWSAAGTWSNVSSAGGDSSGPPGTGDNVIFDAGSGNVTIDATANCLDVDFTGYTGTLTHNNNINWNIYGNFTMVSGMGYTANQLGSITNFLATGAKLITSGGKQVSQPRFNGVGGKWTLQDNWTLNSTFSNITITEGELDTNGKTLTVGILATGSGSNPVILTFGASTINIGLAGNANSWNMLGSNITLNAGTSTINITGAPTTCRWGSLTYNNFSITGQTATMNCTGAATFASLTLTSSAAAGGFTLANNISATTLVPTGTSLSNRNFIRSNTIGTARTITVTNSVTTADNTDWQDITISGITLSGASIGDGGGNSGITFTTAVTRYWVATLGGNWNATSSWATTSGGASGATVPLAQDTVIIDANSITVAASTIQGNLSVPFLGKDITFTGVLNSPTFALAINGMTGSLTLASGMTVTGSFGMTFHNRSDATLTRGGATVQAPISIRGHGATMTLQDDWTSTSSVSVVTGTFDTGNNNITAPVYQNTSVLVSVTTAPVSNLGSSTITCTGTTTPWNYFNGTINAGTSTIKITDTSSTAIASIPMGNQTYYTFWISRGASTGSNTFTGSPTINTFKDDGSAAHSLIFTAGTRISFKALDGFQVTGTAGNVITINSTTTGTFTFKLENDGIISTDYLNIQHCLATPSYAWYAGNNSVDNQSTATAGEGWIFTTPQGRPRNNLLTIGSG